MLFTTIGHRCMPMLIASDAADALMASRLFVFAVACFR